MSKPEKWDFLFSLDSLKKNENKKKQQQKPLLPPTNNKTLKEVWNKEKKSKYLETFRLFLWWYSLFRKKKKKIHKIHIAAKSSTSSTLLPPPLFFFFYLEWLIQAVLFIWKLLVRIISICRTTISQLYFRTVKCLEAFYGSCHLLCTFDQQKMDYTVLLSG